mgnify:CR=1 FL=1|jgi:hypothetical protein
MYESVLTELLWFAAGYLLTLLSLVWLALCYREPEIIKKGAIACPVAWFTLEIFIRALLLVL